jgi:dipeptidyl aminopeptidase/acylaminoacyl peptidase
MLYSSGKHVRPRRGTMQLKRKLVLVASGYVLLLSSIVLLISVPAQAPEKTQIVFASNCDGNWEIYVMDADGENQRRLTHHPATDWSPAWSPDGQSIAFESYRGGSGEIYVMDADGKAQCNLTNNPAYDFSQREVQETRGAELFGAGYGMKYSSVSLLTCSLFQLTDLRR